MKFCMNGALTIGTLDGANIEIRDEVGADNFFLFGLSAQEVFTLKAGGYRPMDYLQCQSGTARRDRSHSQRASSRAGDTELFRPLIDGLLYQDPYLLLADLPIVHRMSGPRRGGCSRDTERWTRMSILNAARSGKFSSDRTIREYCSDIWRVESVPISLLTHAEAGNA